MVTSELIERPQYTDWLQRWKDRDVIKVITGLRRCSKTMDFPPFAGCGRHCRKPYHLH